LNASFTKFCRRCKAALPDTDPREGEPLHWKQLRLSQGDAIPTGIGEPKLLAEISSLSRQGSNPGSGPSSRVMLAMVEGILAVHNPGYFQGLCRPFQDREGEPWIWKTEDAKEVRRAFPPVILHDRRHLIFSTPRHVSVVDLWGCTSLSAYRRSDQKRRLDLSQFGAELLTPPIPLGGGKVGLLLQAGTRGARWLVWDTASSDDDLSRRTNAALQPERKIAVTGKPCHTVVLEGVVILFSTPTGHWVWSVEDAAAERHEAINNTWGDNRDGQDRIPVAHDERDDKPPAQVFATSNLRGHGERPRFEWYFEVVSDDNPGVSKILSYEVQLKNGAASRPELFSKRDARPLAFLDEELLCEGARASLFRQRPGAEYSTPYEGVLVDGMVTFAMQGNLLFMQAARKLESSEATGQTSSRFLRVCSLNDHSRRVEKELGIMRSEPLAWASWVFTAEILDGVLGIRRRKLEFQSVPVTASRSF
jgi:hypothetical protein